MGPLTEAGPELVPPAKTPAGAGTGARSTGPPTRSGAILTLAPGRGNSDPKTSRNSGKVTVIQPPGYDRFHTIPALEWTGGPAPI